MTGYCTECGVTTSGTDEEHLREVHLFGPTSGKRVADHDPLPVTMQLCERCGGEGLLYTSRYGGNDPDVWPTGECPECDGTGYELIEEEIDEEETMTSHNDGDVLAVARRVDTSSAHDYALSSPHSFPSDARRVARAYLATREPDFARAAFLNRLRSLHNIDRDQLPELTDGEWISFRHNPTEFLIRADDTQADAIWREVERRQALVAA